MSWNLDSNAEEDAACDILEANEKIKARIGHFINKVRILINITIKGKTKPNKKAPGGRLAGTARRGCGGWEISY
jgi:hypothetical protein